MTLAAESVHISWRGGAQLPKWCQSEDMADHLTLRFLGGAGTVTGSKFLLTWRNRRLMVDCGQFQGLKELRELNWRDFPVDPASIDMILLTHAHLDHSGYLPALVRRGFQGRILATKATIELAEIVLRDAAHLQEQDAADALRGGYSKHEKPEPLFDTDDVERTLPLFQEIPIHQVIDLGDDLRVKAWRAGHIIGSVCFRLWVEGQEEEESVIFSGDLGRADHPVLADREVPDGAANVLIESTYGDRTHPAEKVSHDILADAISRTIKRGGNVLIPAFAVDRTEVLLHALSEMIKAGEIPEVPIWVNSPMGLRALDVYRDPDNQDEIGPEFKGKPFYDLPTLREARSKEDSIRLNNPDEPSIIISSSGMATGGRVVHHLQHMLPDPKNSVVFIGYQSPGTRGRSLVDGAKQLKMYGRYVPVRAEIVQDGSFSGHADVNDLLSWLREITPRPQVAYCVHGEPSAAQVMADRIEAELGIVAVVPKLDEIVRLS